MQQKNKTANILHVCIHCGWVGYPTDAEWLFPKFDWAFRSDYSCPKCKAVLENEQEVETGLEHYTEAKTLLEQYKNEKR